MTVRTIAQIGDPVLRKSARNLTREELASREIQGFIDDLVETMRNAKGAGLAATQVSELLSICCIEVNSNPRYPYKPNIPLTVLINPVVEVLDEERFDNFEGCLSVPNLRGVVPRAMNIRVQAWDRHGADIDNTIRGITAGTYQHEVDHLHGVVFLDRVADTTTLSTWEEFKRHHEASFAAEVRAIVARVGQ